MGIPEDLYFTKEHEWVRLDGNVATVGITSHAVDELGEIVFVELPKVGDESTQMGEFGTVESVKTVSSLYSPLTGKVTEVNDAVKSSPEVINADPYNDGWLIRLEVTQPDEVNGLMSADDYEAYLKTV